MQPMSMAPFGAPPITPQSERRRARLAVAIATLGIAATLLAYSLSPGVRHAVSHAAHSVAHSVKRAVSGVLDRDATKHGRAKKPPAGGHATRSRAATSRATTSHAPTSNTAPSERTKLTQASPQSR